MSADTDNTLDTAYLAPSGALIAAHIAVGAAIDQQAVAETGHDPTTLDLLVRLDLAPNEALRAVELCRQLQLSPSHISRMIDRAEAAGLVAREPDPTDRRANLVTLTDAGRRLVGDFAPRLYGVLHRIIYETLSTSEIATFTDMLERVEAAARLVSSDG